MSIQKVVEAEAERQANVELSDLHEIMSTPAGRRLLYALIDRCGVFGSAFDKDTHTMAFLEGRRSVGIDFTQQLQEAVPEFYLQMIVEHAKRAAEYSMKLQAEKR